MFVSRISGDHDIAEAILFGSRARLTYSPDSDADFANLLRGERQPFLPTKLAMADSAFDVFLETGVNISPLPIWLDNGSILRPIRIPLSWRTLRTKGVRL